MNFDAIHNKLGAIATQAQGAVDSAMGSLDPKDPTSLLQFQRFMSELVLTHNVQSNTMKSIEDLCKTIANNVR